MVVSILFITPFKVQFLPEVWLDSELPANSVVACIYTKYKYIHSYMMYKDIKIDIHNIKYSSQYLA